MIVLCRPIQGHLGAEVFGLEFQIPSAISGFCNVSYSFVLNIRAPFAPKPQSDRCTAAFSKSGIRRQAIDNLDTMYAECSW